MYGYIVTVLMQLLCFAVHGQLRNCGMVVIDVPTSLIAKKRPRFKLSKIC